MCEFCGCGFVKARPEVADARGVPVLLATIPVRIVEPGAEEANRALRQRKSRVEYPPLQRAPRSP